LTPARDMTPAREPGPWVERVGELKSTLLRKTDIDDVPVKPQRVYKEINEFFDPETVFLTAIGLYQIFGGQFQKTYKPRHYICCGQAGRSGGRCRRASGPSSARRASSSSGSWATTPSSS
jgi:tartronate-semialdehyde synthase